MEEILRDWKVNAEENKEANFEFLKSIVSSSTAERNAAQLHKEVFAEADCLQCANCCRTTPALVTRSDAKRIAKYLGIPPKTFIKKFLLEDTNGELMIQKVPCTFLQENNTCEIYEVRPQACREYPHTNQSGFKRRAKMNANNTIVCPATYEIIQRLKSLENYIQ